MTTECPQIKKKDGRSGPGAWLCPLCKRWHYLKRNPVRRGTARTMRLAIAALYAKP